MSPYPAVELGNGVETHIGNFVTDVQAPMSRGPTEPRDTFTEPETFLILQVDDGIICALTTNYHRGSTVNPPNYTQSWIISILHRHCPGSEAIHQVGLIPTSPNPDEPRFPGSVTRRTSGLHGFSKNLFVRLSDRLTLVRFCAVYGLLSADTS